MDHIGEEYVRQLIILYSPFIVVFIIAIFTALYHLRRKPIVSLLTIVSFLLLFGSMAFVPVFVSFLEDYKLGQAIKALSQLVTVVGFIILLNAIYRGRGEQALDK